MTNTAAIDKIPWKLDVATAAIWGVLAALTAIAVLPYLQQLTPETFEKIDFPFPVLVALQAVQALVLIGLLSLIGLRMGHHVGLGSPILQHKLQRRPLPDLATLKPLQAIVLGVLAAITILGASLLLDPLMPAALHPPTKAPAATSALYGLLASFYGGITEELQLRLFLMTLLVWLFAAFGRRTPRPVTFWIAIVIAALAFGAGHLPAADKIWGLSDIVILRTVALNAIGGVVFGWLYWKRGIEIAMLGHFSADIVLHVLTPLLPLVQA